LDDYLWVTKTDCHQATPMPGDRGRPPINGRLRDELLNETLFSSLSQARAALARWQLDYNTARPHSKLGWQPPNAFASACPALKERRAPSRPHLPTSGVLGLGECAADSLLTWVRIHSISSIIIICL
jgi:hypothetical protein